MSEAARGASTPSLVMAGLDGSSITASAKIDQEEIEQEQYGKRADLQIARVR